ncbi:MAG: 16S rRNA (guanine(966)-N(2))-methyltransferase RsmD [Chloroflexi bacterium HGW-Chloroflexi-8]|nr:MAG: 16S rRNA (guanine(966)-N(2))-methyltransferase RsmD [Chloroflexi bacterium HGW-Chloroflexi-8]
MSTLRIISGTAKGMRIRSVPGDSTRPITDRVKESLFNIIGNDIVGANFLDLFCGTGSVSIEALSRKAAYARMLDLHSLAVKTINLNLETTKLISKAKVIRVDSLSYIKNNPDLQFDYIYIAPPQYKEIWKQTILLLDQNINWLHEDGWVIVQIHPNEFLEIDLSNLVVFDKRKYGSTLLVFYQRK